MVSELNTFSHKGCKIAAQKSLIFDKFCPTSRICLVLGLLSVLVERCFVSRMQEFCHQDPFLICIIFGILDFQKKNFISFKSVKI